MPTKIKYLAFKGIEKKEQILFKSFLNLAKNELDYQVVILKVDHEDEPDILILDESFEFDDINQGWKERPTIFIGNDVTKQDLNYLSRPVQWSDFKRALTQLNVDVAEDQGTVDRILPDDIEFAISDSVETIQLDQPKNHDQASVQAEDEDFEYELENMSVDYNSFTNSDYVEVVDDVRKFNVDDGEEGSKDPVLLITDDESSFANSVLIIETNSNDAWDITLSENLSESLIDPDVSDDGENSYVDEEIVLEQKVGLHILPNEAYWLSDNEIIANHQTLFYIKPERDMVYSPKEPGHWAQLLTGGTLSKLPMNSDWQPKTGFKPYSINCLHWVNTLIYKNSEIAPDLDEESAYILIKWPQFDLIELDNTLLKLCSMMFVKPETVSSLIAKSGHGRDTIIGLINACHRIGILEAATNVDKFNQAATSSSEGVLGKIKDVFR